MIHDLDRTLEELLKLDLPQSIVDQVTISFATPNNQFPPASVPLPAVNLFLYDVRENRDLRSNEHVVERRADGTAVRTRAPARIDCSYLVTAWPSDASNSPAMDEHKLLGAVMWVLLRHPTIPEAVLQGSLGGQGLPLPTSALQPGHLQNLGEFWQALGGRPRAALNYTVTLALQLDTPEELGPVVTARTLRLDPVES
ncbi:MAG: DUF4255 domain-containing protein [Gemmatimonadetes bacterium]|nr:DUF4255 domain-containing protein [Gemmatimonadota bacterium]